MRGAKIQPVGLNTARHQSSSKKPHLRFLHLRIFFIFIFFISRVARRSV